MSKWTRMLRKHQKETGIRCQKCGKRRIARGQVALCRVCLRRQLKRR